MFSVYTVSMIIPCYNEETGLEYILRQLPDCIDEVIVIDNNSTDTTAQIAQQKGAKVFIEKKKGYGLAYMKGFREATGQIFVTMDGDGTYPAEKIKTLIEFLIKNNINFISACRFPLHEKKNMDRWSKIGNSILPRITNYLFDLNLRDSQSGMWVFQRNCLDKIRLESKGMSFSEEIKLKVIRAGLSFREVHIPYHKRIGEKKMKKFRDGLKNILFLLRLKFKSIE